MLDDLKYIHERDAQDALGIAEKQWQQLQQAYQFTPLGELETLPIRNIVVAGMGGSALAAAIVQSAWPKALVPFEISRGYEIPHYVDASTLFIASSYSGNTEETLAALAEAEARDARIAVIAAGGALGARAQEKQYPFLALPGGYQPRHAVLYNFKALLLLLEPAGLIGRDKIQEAEQAAEFLKTAVSAWRPDVAAKDNYAKQLAQELMGKSPVVYGGPLMFPIAYKWKISFNENAKNVAWCNQYPEFNHNEFIGWSSHPTEKPYGVIDLRSSFEHPQVQKRFEVSARLLSGQRPAPLVVEAEGKSPLEQLLWTSALGDFVSLYLALLNGINPTPVDLVEKLKQELG